MGEGTPPDRRRRADSRSMTQRSDGFVRLIIQPEISIAANVAAT
jgi:hypothetical protein